MASVGGIITLHSGMSTPYQPSLCSTHAWDFPNQLDKLRSEAPPDSEWRSPVRLNSISHNCPSPSGYPAPVTSLPHIRLVIRGAP